MEIFSLFRHFSQLLQAASKRRRSSCYKTFDENSFYRNIRFYYTICGAVSIVFLLITLLVYFTIPELKNFQVKRCSTMSSDVGQQIRSSLCQGSTVRGQAIKSVSSNHTHVECDLVVDVIKLFLEEIDNHEFFYALN